MIIAAHGARISTQSPPNTIKGIWQCIQNGFYYIEVDIAPVGEDDFLIFHNEKLNSLTNGEGYTALLDKYDRSSLWYVNENKEKTSRVYLLSEFIKLMVKDKRIKELQLDFKTYFSSNLTEDLLKNLISIISSVKNRIRITSCADWVIISLREMDKTIKLGFDPQFFIDFRKEKIAYYPPYNINKYGYFDDHPIAFYDWKTPGEYLYHRARTLCFSGLGSDIWYIRYLFLKQSLYDGFDWIKYFHKQGIQVCIWTIDINKDTNMQELNRIISMNPDRINTNTPAQWLSYLNRKKT